MNSILRSPIFVLAACCVLRGAGPPGAPVPASTVTHSASGLAGVLVSLPSRSIYQVDAAWTDDSGRTIRLADLRGHPVVLAMFFARCQGACPVIVATMQGLQAALPAAQRAETRFVLISFDSENDSPAALRAYRREAKLPPETWVLARGDPDAVRELAMVLGLSYRRIGNGQYAHSTMITVLNWEGEIAYQQTDLGAGQQAALQAVMLAAK